MELRYILTGSIILIVSAVFLMYGFITNNNSIIGISLSFLVPGVVVLALGLTYSEPYEELLESYTRNLELFFTRILEDSGVIGDLSLKVCIDKKLFVYSGSNISCKDTYAGIGIKDGLVFAAVSAETIFDFVVRETQNVDELFDKLRLVIIESGKLCKGLNLKKDGDIVWLEMIGIASRAARHLSMPINVSKLYLLATLATHYKSNIEVVEEEITQDNYRIKLRILGETS